MTRRQCFVAGVVMLFAYNVARGVGAFGSFGDASAIFMLGMFVVLAWMTKLTAVELGLARGDLRSGAMYGFAALLFTVAMVGIIAAIPASADFFDDARADVSGPRLIVEVAVPILALTVIPEEFAFRGVLLACGRALWGDRVAVLVSSALFGLWHISPTLGTMSENRRLDDATTTMGGSLLLVTGTVLATAVAGVVFSWLRLRSRSLLAPVLAHLATNGVAMVAAWFVVR